MFALGDQTIDIHFRPEVWAAMNQDRIHALEQNSSYSKPQSLFDTIIEVNNDSERYLQHAKTLLQSKGVINDETATQTIGTEEGLQEALLSSDTKLKKKTILPYTRDDTKKAFYFLMIFLLHVNTQRCEGDVYGKNEAKAFSVVANLIVFP